MGSFIHCDRGFDMPTSAKADQNPAIKAAQRLTPTLPAERGTPCAGARIRRGHPRGTGGAVDARANLEYRT